MLGKQVQSLGAAMQIVTGKVVASGGAASYRFRYGITHAFRQGARMTLATLTTPRPKSDHVYTTRAAL